MGLFSNDASDDVSVSATFPESNPFGLITNGDATEILIHLANGGSKNYTLVSAASSYHNVDRNWALIKNQTAVKYNVPLISGSNFSAPYNLYSEYRPSEIGLTVWVNLAEPPSKDLIPVVAFNQTVSVVESPTRWFDPSLLMVYTLLLAGLASLGWFGYQSYFGTKTKSKKKSGGIKKVVVPAQQADKSYPDVKPYEEEWIPSHHLKSSGTKLKKRGGGAASSGGEEVTSGGEITSGAELSGAEGKKKGGKGKAKKA